MELPARIVGTGVYQPGRLVTSAEMDSWYGRTAGTTAERSGVVSRRWVTDVETSSVMAAGAVRQALAAAGMDAGDLDALIVATVLPEQPMPTTAVLTMRELGATGGRLEAFDVNSSCLGFLTGVEIAVLGLAAARWKAVAVVSTEIASKGLDHNVVESSALFGDGAAAAVMVGDPASAVLGLKFGHWPEAAEASTIGAGGTRWNVCTPPPDERAYLFSMDGPALLRATMRHLPSFLSGLAEQTGFGLDQADLVVPHQASAAGLRLLHRLGAPRDRIVNILADHGNQVAASIPTALHHAVTTGRLARGDRAVLLGSGAGLGLGAVALRF